MSGITDRQQQVYDTIRAHIERYGVSPRHRDIGDALGMSSTCSVQKHIDALVRKGRLRRVVNAGGVRAMRLELLGDDGKPVKVVHRLSN